MSRPLEHTERPFAAGLATPSPAHPPRPRPAWLREPLLHFFAAGALLFAIDAFIATRTEDPTRIVITAQVDSDLRTLFSDENARPPSAQEMKTLRQRWLDNEMLYREGLALGLDRGDTGIRERVIFKALNVVQANLQAPAADEAALQAWFTQHRARYDDPPRMDLLEAVVSGKPDRAALEAFAGALNAGRADTSTSGLRIFRGRPLASIRAAFGSDFLTRVESLPLSTWAVADATDGPRVVMVEARKAAVPANFAAVRERVVQDWRDQRLAELRTGAVRALADKYTVRVAAEPQP